MKRALLAALFPGSEKVSGYPARYHMATPGRYRHWAEGAGLRVMLCRAFYWSPYFGAFFPAFLLWRLYTLIAAGLAGERAAETFIIVLEKPDATIPSP